MNDLDLDEYYFENLKAGGNGMPDKKSSFFTTAEKNFGGYDIWRADFAGIGSLRSVGWAIGYQDPINGRLSNHWVGFVPILVMDAWEPASLSDYKLVERSKYVDLFFSNIDWDGLDERLVT